VREAAFVPDGATLQKVVKRRLSTFEILYPILILNRTRSGIGLRICGKLLDYSHGALLCINSFSFSVGAGGSSSTRKSLRLIGREIKRTSVEQHVNSLLSGALDHESAESLVHCRCCLLNQLLGLKRHPHRHRSIVTGPHCFSHFMFLANFSKFGGLLKAPGRKALV